MPDPKLRADLLTPALTAAPGSTQRIELEVLNTGDVIDQVTVEVDRIDPSRCAQEPAALSLFPGEAATVAVVLRLPQAFPAGFHEMTVTVRGRSSGAVVVHSVLIEVEPVVATTLRVNPELATGGRRGRMTIEATNTGNTDVQLVLRAYDSEQRLRSVIEPPTLTIAPKQTGNAALTVRGRRPWFGAPVVHSLAVSGEQLPHVVETEVSFRQRPRIPTGAITVLTLAAIVALWAVAVTFGVRAALAGPPAKKSVPVDFATGIDPATLDPAVVGADVSGKVTAATTGKPLPRVTVELFDGRGTRIAAGATKDDGTFKLPAVLPGRYGVRFRAEGYPDRWYPGVADQNAAKTVTVVAATPLKGVDLSVAGAGGVLSGTILAGDDPGVAVTVSIEAADLADGVTPPIPFPVIQSVAAGGTFRVADLPTPATYRVRASAPGFQPQELQEEVPGGGDVVVNAMRLAAAPGSIAGIVLDAAGKPVGDVKITTTVAGKEITTLTPTAGSIGEFRLTNLPSPATYVVTLVKAGLQTEVIGVRLGPGENAAGRAVTLGSQGGVVTGTVTDERGVGLGGVEVSVIGGDGMAGELRTLTFTSGQVGSYRLTGLPLPGSYTLQFSLTGRRAETLRVNVAKTSPEVGADARLVPSVGAINGTVRSPAAVGLGNATVELSDGENVRRTSTASTPAGSTGTFTFVDLTPGTYTVTVRSQGYRNQTMLVTVAAGAPMTRELTLAVAS